MFTNLRRKNERFFAPNNQTPEKCGEKSEEIYAKLLSNCRINKFAWNYFLELLLTNLKAVNYIGLNLKWWIPCNLICSSYETILYRIVMKRTLCGTWKTQHLSDYVKNNCNSYQTNSKAQRIWDFKCVNICASMKIYIFIGLNTTGEIKTLKITAAKLWGLQTLFDSVVIYWREYVLRMKLLWVSIVPGDILCR